MIWVVIFFSCFWQTSLNKNIPCEYSGNADFVYPIKSKTIFILADGWFFLSYSFLMLWKLRRSGKQMNSFFICIEPPKISMHILLTSLYPFPMLQTRRVCSTVKSLSRWWSFLLSHGINVWFNSDTVRIIKMPITFKGLEG